MTQSSTSEQFPGDDAILTQLIERLAAGDRPLAAIATELERSLPEVARLGLADDTIETLRRLAQLADVQAQMLLSTYRASAAMRLIAIASADEPTELSRKACVDLLKMNLDVFTRPAEPDSAPPAPTEESILAALEKLGEELD